MHIEKGRIGEFFLFIGLIILIIFFATDQSQDPQTWLFFVGVIVLGLGIYFIWRDWKPPAPSQRFKIFRKQEGKKKEGGKEKT